MAGFEYEPWEYSNVEEEKAYEPETGQQYLSIKDARLNTKDNGRESIGIMYESLAENGGSFWIWYDITGVKKDGATFPLKEGRNALISLGAALAGKAIGIPPLEPMVGCVVLAEVTQKYDSYREKNMTHVDTFYAVEKDIAEGFCTRRNKDGTVGQYYYEEGSE